MNNTNRTHGCTKLSLILLRVRQGMDIEHSRGETYPPWSGGLRRVVNASAGQGTRSSIQLAPSSPVKGPLLSKPQLVLFGAQIGSAVRPYTSLDTQICRA